MQKVDNFIFSIYLDNYTFLNGVNKIIFSPFHISTMHLLRGGVLFANINTPNIISNVSKAISEPVISRSGARSPDR